MTVNLRWVGESDLERVAETRMRCYAPAGKELPAYIERLRNDPLSGPGDWLLAERDGEAVGTATSLPLTMWVRGGPVACQGVAYVGTIRTQRRGRARTPSGTDVGGDSGGRRARGAGIASLVMNETLRAARERGFVVSALMPFRGSFYEKFGYGFVERRAQWTIPMSILPRDAGNSFEVRAGEASGAGGSGDARAGAGAGGERTDLRFYRDADFDELVRFRQQLTQRTHGDIERSAATWRADLAHAAEHGHIVIERSAPTAPAPAPAAASSAAPSLAPGAAASATPPAPSAGPIRAMLSFAQSHLDHRDTLVVDEALYADIAGLRRLLVFLGTLRDQYSAATITLPADLPLNRLLAETQMTHRQNRNHPTAEARPYNRMQVRILDHVKFLSAMKLPPRLPAGKVVIAIRETEGHVTKLAIEFADARVAATATNAPPDVEMPDTLWAPIALGDLPASRAAALGLIAVHTRAALPLLDTFSATGPAPFCREYF